MNPASSARTRWLALAVLALFLLVLARIAFAVYIRSTTGTLYITTKEPSAVISISQENKKAVFLGKGDVRVRLKRGDYLVSATLAGDIATATVNIDSGKTTSEQLNPVHTTPPVSSTAQTSFINFDTLVNNGLTADQATNLENSLRVFASKAQIIKIDSSSMHPLPHDPNSTIFELQFDLTIDSVPYHALVQYVNFGDAVLSLTDTNGQQVFNSSPTGD
jgi:hypothetical protein